uniref:Uncharacterized protein n=1 Tax=Brassica oleracea var. oleracea TaxID=109376 RepID=A0A0D3CG45_BRAOL
MAETDFSSTKDKAGWINGEHTDLKPAEVRVDELDELSELSDTTLELNELSNTTLELDDLSDTTLELSELSDTEDGAGLAAGRNGPCSAQGKVHKKCNIEHFLFLGVVSSKQTSLFCWTCASYQATDRNPSFVGLVRQIKQQLKSGSGESHQGRQQDPKKSTTTCVPVAEPSLIISGKPKESYLVFDDEDTGLTCFEPEHLSIFILSSQDFEEEPFDYQHQGPLLGTRRPMDADLCPIFDEEDDHLDEDLGPTFDEKALSITSIIMENQLCFDPGTTPTPLFTDIQEHCEKLDLIDSLPEMFVKFLKHSKGFDHLEKSLELSLQHRLKRVLHVLGKETLIYYLNKYMSCTYDPGTLVYVLSVQDKQVQSPRSVRNRSIGRAYQSEIWRCMYSRKMASKLQGSFFPKFSFTKFYMFFKFFLSNSFTFDTGKMDLRSNPFQEGGNYAPRIVDPGQDDVIMAETDVSSTKDKP